MGILWIDKYHPKNIKEIIGSQVEINKIRNWLDNIDTSKKMSLVLSGNIGIEKTTIAKLILEEYNYFIKIISPNEIKEFRKNMNFDDYYKFEKSIFNTINFVGKKKKKISLILDESETITLNTEKKFIHEIFKTNNKKKMFPLIFICNDQHTKLLNDIKKNCIEIIFKKPTIHELTKFIKKILTNENITFENDKDINMIIEYGEYNIRKIITTLQELSFSNNVITSDIINTFMTLSKKELNIDGLFNTTLHIVNNTFNLTYNDIYNLYENDKVLLPLMIHENYPKKLINKNKKIDNNHYHNISNITNVISIGDTIETSIYTDQNWYLQKVHCFYSCICSIHWIKNYDRKLDYSDIKFSSDLNKTSLKNINKKNINNINTLLPNKSLQEIMYINKISNYLINNNRTRELIKIIKSYNNNIDIKDIELCLKIDKTSDFLKMTTKEKKDIMKEYV